MIPSNMPMVVEYIKIPSPNMPSQIKPIGVRFCCSDMAHHFHKGVIQFGQRKEETATNRLSDVFIRIEGGAQVAHSSVFPDGPNYKPNTDIALPYCPWCREPVMTVEIQLESLAPGFDPA